MIIMWYSSRDSYGDGEDNHDDFHDSINVKEEDEYDSDNYDGYDVG
jgi:hypothetical protein